MDRSLKGWIIFIVRRMLFLTVALLGIAAFSFFATRKVGSPIYLMVGTEYTQEMLESAAQRIGLDQPLWIQFKNYIVNILHGNLGVSRFTYNPVTVDLASRLPATIELAFVAFLMVLLWSIPAGILSGEKRGTLIDKSILFTSRTGVAVADFWFGLILIYVFFFLLHWFPAPLGRLGPQIGSPDHITGLYIIDSLLTWNMAALKSSLAQIFLPAFTLAFTISPYILFMVRATTLTVIDSDFMLNAHAFGLGSFTRYQYLGKNIMPPVLTLSGLNFAHLLGGAVLVETVYS